MTAFQDAPGLGFAFCGNKERPLTKESCRSMRERPPEAHIKRHVFEPLRAGRRRQGKAEGRGRQQQSLRERI